MTLPDIGEEFTRLELLEAACAALLFTLIYGLFYPITAHSLREIFSLKRLRTRFLPGVAQGLILGGTVIFVFVVAGSYEYLGFFTHLGETSNSLAGIAFRILGLMSWVYCEEFFFRHKFFQLLGYRLFPWIPIVLSALLSMAFRWFQFDIDPIQAGTLFLAYIWLAFRSYTEREFSMGAGLWCGLLILLHPILGLPIFGIETTGMFLFQFFPHFTSGISLATETVQLLTGALSGPLSGIIFQFLFLFRIIHLTVENRIYLFNKPMNALR